MQYVCNASKQYDRNCPLLHEDKAPLIDIMICVTCIFIVCCICGRRNVSWRERERMHPHWNNIENKETY